MKYIIDNSGQNIATQSIYGTLSVDNLYLNNINSTTQSSNVLTYDNGVIGYTSSLGGGLTPSLLNVIDVNNDIEDRVVRSNMGASSSFSLDKPYLGTSVMSGHESSIKMDYTIDIKTENANGSSRLLMVPGSFLSVDIDDYINGETRRLSVSGRTVLANEGAEIVIDNGEIRMDSSKLTLYVGDVFIYPDAYNKYFDMGAYAYTYLYGHEELHLNRGMTGSTTSIGGKVLMPNILSSTQSSNVLTYDNGIIGYTQSNGIYYQEINRIDLLDLIANNNIVKGKLYKVMDAVGSSEILLTGISSNLVSKNGLRYKSVPNWSKLLVVTNFKGVFMESMTISTGDIVSYSGRLWESVNGTSPYPMDDINLDATAFTLLPSSNVNYKIEEFGVEYDIVNDTILLQRDSDNNICTDSPNIDYCDWYYQNDLSHGSVYRNNKLGHFANNNIKKIENNNIKYCLNNVGEELIDNNITYFHFNIGFGYFYRNIAKEINSSIIDEAHDNTVESIDRVRGTIFRLNVGNVISNVDIDVCASNIFNTWLNIGTPNASIYNNSIKHIEYLFSTNLNTVVNNNIDRIAYQSYDILTSIYNNKVGILSDNNTAILDNNNCLEISNNIMTNSISDNNCSKINNNTEINDGRITGNFCENILGNNSDFIIGNIVNLIENNNTANIVNNICEGIIENIASDISNNNIRKRISSNRMLAINTTISNNNCLEIINATSLVTEITNNYINGSIDATSLSGIVTEALVNKS